MKRISEQWQKMELMTCNGKSWSPLESEFNILMSNMFGAIKGTSCNPDIVEQFK